MSIQFNMASAQELEQEEFVRGVLNPDNFGGDCEKIGKQSLPPQPFYPDEFQVATDKKISKGKKRARRNDKNHDEELPDHEIHIWTERERRKKMRDMFAKLHALLPQLPPKADKSTIVDEAVSCIKSLEQKIQKLHAQKLEKLRYSSSASNTTPTITYDPSSSSSPSTLLTPISNQSKILPVGADSYSREAFMADQISSSNATTVNLPYPCNDPLAVFDTWSSPNVVLNIYGNEASFSLCFPKDKSGVLTTVCYFFEKYNIEVLSGTISTNVFRRTYMFQAQVNPSCQAQVMGDGYGVGEIFKQVAQELVLYYSSP